MRDVTIARLLRIAAGLQVLFASTALPAQQPGLKVVGDTTGAPPGCSAAAAVAAITEWFAAFQAADSARLARVSAAGSPGVFVVSMGGFAPADTFVTFGFLEDVVRYARQRARQHERFTLEGVRFYGWRGWNGRALGFMPYYQRSADDLGPAPRPGVGKAEYHCGRGVAVLNLAPRPAFDPGL
jgi:hypothetical protein